MEAPSHSHLAPPPAENSISPIFNGNLGGIQQFHLGCFQEKIVENLDFDHETRVFPENAPFTQFLRTILLAFVEASGQQAIPSHHLPILGLCWPILGAMLAHLEAYVGPC